MSVNPKIYSKCLSADENRSFSYLVTNENAVITCGVTTKGKIITLERLGAAYCLKLYCLTTNSQKWERIIQKDMKVLQYSNINIFVINDEKHAFELVDRDESVKLYEKIRGCIKKLSASTNANPANQPRTDPTRAKHKPERPPPTYKSSVNRPLQSNVLTVPVTIVDDLVDVSVPSSVTSSSDSNADNSSNRNAASEGRRPTPRVRYPEETSRSALPNSTLSANPNVSSPLSDRRIPTINSGNPNISSPVLNYRGAVVRSPVAKPRSVPRHPKPSTNNTVTEERRPTPRIRYPEESSRSALPRSPTSISPNLSSPLLGDRRVPTNNPASNISPVVSDESAEAQNRTLSLHLSDTVANIRIPIPTPRKNPPHNVNRADTRNPGLEEELHLTQELGIPIVDPGRVPKTTASQSQLNIAAVTVLSRQNSAENSPEARANLGSTSNQSRRNITITSPVLNRRVPNLLPTATYSSNLGSDGGSNINSITGGYEPGSTSSVIAAVINARNLHAQTSTPSGNNSSATDNNRNLTNATVSSTNLQGTNHTVIGGSSNVNPQLNTTNGSTNISLPTSISSPSLPIHLANSNRDNSSPLSNRRHLVNNSNFLPAPVGSEPTLLGVNGSPIQGPRRRVKTANSSNRQKARSAFVQPTSMVTDIIVQVKSKFFTKEEESAPPKCMVIGNPTNVTHQMHLDSLDFRNMQLQDNQLKGLIKSKSMENLSSSLDTNLKLFEMDEDGPTCVICLTDPPTHVIVPCGHKILCEACVEQNVLGKLRRKWCMTCNGLIREIIKVYD